MLRPTDSSIPVEAFAAQMHVLIDVFTVRYPSYSKEDPAANPPTRRPEEWLDALSNFARVAYLPDWPD
jgi:hypothetical protein